MLFIIILAFGFITLVCGFAGFLYQKIESRRRRREDAQRHEMQRRALQRLMSRSRVEIVPVTTIETLADEIAAISARQQEVVEQQKLVIERSKALLRAVLTEHEWQQFEKQQAISMQGSLMPHITYVVTMGMVEVFQYGKHVKRLCLEAAEFVPRYDLVTTRVLMLRADEKAFWEQANAFSGTRYSQHEILQEYTDIAHLEPPPGMRMGILRTATQP